jgi:RimJ/RimL family protein N-acetyltransferase
VTLMIDASPVRIARPMQLSETDLVADYFLRAAPEYLKSLGVDPARVPTRVQWQARFAQQFALPVERREIVLVLWELDGEPAGFSSSDKIKLGDEAYMHLHILHPERRQKGNGAIFVRQTAKIYFETLKIKRLFCEPYALNVAPNRTLQAAGFKYIKTHETVPGPMNFHQPVTRWMIEREAVL